ncbi:Mesoderm posterior protein 1 [Triplophysa tibetana]|uniref:Mesoderm posterior protein 1 n=1 Tax=Triplophysa tibetana TaxID=1572043 RepID=A0A5A9PL66_9TELE|nr:Mesoderm posterior protein 1 [Triplophysa tibetana]
MDISSSSLHVQDGTAFLLNCQSFLDQSNLVSDAGYYSGSMSPTSSIDSCGFSPPTYSCRAGQPQIYNTTQVKKSQPPKRTGRPRSKFPGVKRETASEREKLRMRDQTKALNHLRTYLPPSMAPAEKTLTKIETLRLAIQYISCLSAQLGFGEEEANRVSSEQIEIEASPSMLNNFSGESLVDQSLPAQQFQHCYQDTDEGNFLTFQAQDFGMQQLHSFFSGQC